MQLSFTTPHPAIYMTQPIIIQIHFFCVLFHKSGQNKNADIKISTAPIIDSLKTATVQTRFNAVNSQPQILSRVPILKFELELFLLHPL